VKKNILICIDRDGTLSYDMRYHLGHTNSWKRKIRFLDNIVPGIKKLRKIKNVKIYMVTNQTGVAIKDFKLLTLQRAHQVCQHIMDKLKDKGAELDGYEICGKADFAYTKKRSQYKFDKKCGLKYVNIISVYRLLGGYGGLVKWPSKSYARNQYKGLSR